MTSISPFEPQLLDEKPETNAGPAIELSQVAKRFRTPAGDVYTAIYDFSLTVGRGEFVSIVGPTGCGKSTTLSLISGLAPASAGEVRVFGDPVRSIQKRIGYVFQGDVLFPWKTVIGNVAAGLRFRGVAKKEASERAREWIARVGLTGFEKHYPHQLSGGMRKRTALAQSLITSPEIILMDEPFSALDVQTRALMEDELLDLWSATSASVVFVTHDLEEAIALSDRVCVMTAGPGTVKGIYTIDLPRPRHVSEIRFEPRFIELYRDIWENLRDEVLLSYERGKANAGG
jgi:NitT/TauT family transport system ATP-binding protein